MAEDKETILNKIGNWGKNVTTGLWNKFGKLLAKVTGLLLGGSLRETLQQQGRKTLSNFVPDEQTLTQYRYKVGESGDSIFLDTMKRLGYSKEMSRIFQIALKREPEVNQLLSLLQRGDITESNYIERMKRLGLNNEEADLLKALVKNRLDPDTAVESILRSLTDKMSESDLRKDLQDQGWTDKRIDQIIEVNKFHPSVQDVVTWTAKEVFEPSIIEDFGLGDEFEEVKANLPSDTIVDEETLRKFWIAHWQHPSFRQFQEMWHRADLKESDFESWAKLIELPPYWRDNFKKILYRTYTRVDIRRMYRDKVLNENEVYEEYRNIGYNDEKAKNMTKFTKNFYKDPPASEKTSADKEKDRLEGLTRARIQDAFEDGRITESKAKELLSGIGLSEIAVEFYLSESRYEIEKDKQDMAVDTVEDEYKAGAIDINEAYSKLGEANLDSDYVDKLLDLWTAERRKTSKLPSKGDLIKFYKGGIISQGEFETQMNNQGFSDKFVSWYVEAINKKLL